MHALARALQEVGDGVLGQPVDLQVGMLLAELVGDGQVAAGVSQPDRRRHVQCALAPGPARRPAPRLRLEWRGSSRIHEVANEEVHLDRVADLREVA